MATSRSASGRLSAEERAVVKERPAEVRAEAKRAKGAAKLAAERADVLAKIDKMPDGDRELAQRLHALVESAAPGLSPKLYYGQPGYARDGKVVVFFRSGMMDKERYSTFGLSAAAAVDDARGLWPTSFAMADLTESAWEQLADIVRRAGAPPS